MLTRRTLADARGKCELLLPSNSSDVVWSALPSVCPACGPNGACATDRFCTSHTMELQNARPTVSVVSRRGEITGVLYPGFWQPDWWDDGSLAPLGPRRAQASGTRQVNGFERGPNLLRRARVVTVRDAVITSNGHVLAGGRRFGAAELQTCRLGSMRNHGRRMACLQRAHVAVMHQKWADAFSHIFFQLLPQLVLLLEHASVRQLPDPVVLLRSTEAHSNENILFKLIGSALGIHHTRIVRAARGYAIQAERASLLYLPPGNCANFAIFPLGVMSKVHKRLAAPPPIEQRTLVVYLRRPCPASRCLVNERVLLAAIRRALLPPYELRIVSPGRVGGSSAAGGGWNVLRPIMERARVIWGPCGSAWGNAFFHAATDDVHLIEINPLHGRASFVKQHHYIGGTSRYWVIEPVVRAAQALSTQHMYETRWLVPPDRLLLILRLAGVARCEPARIEDVGVVPLIACAMNESKPEWVELSPPPPPPPPPPPAPSPQPGRGRAPSAARMGRGVVPLRMPRRRGERGAGGGKRSWRGGRGRGRGRWRLPVVRYSDSGAFV